jgi:hypothetical protein
MKNLIRLLNAIHSALAQQLRPEPLRATPTPPIFLV